MAESGITAADNVLEIGRRYLVRRDVERKHLVGQVVKAQVLPGLPVGSRRNGFGDEETAIGGQTFKDSLLKGELSRSNNPVSFESKDNSDRKSSVYGQMDDRPASSMTGSARVE